MLLVIFVVLLIFVNISFLVLSSRESDIDEDGPEDLEFLGFDVEKLISFVNGVLALLLFLLTFLAYRRSNKQRLLYVSIAFLLFSVRSFLVATELFMDELPFIDPISVVLDFIILLTFFYGILKK